MARAFPAGLLTCKTKCLCWKMERRDGTVMGFTDHDRDLTFDSVTFQKSTSFQASAIESQLGLAVSNLDLLGMLKSGSVTEDDLEAGRYDGATLTIYVVNWKNVSERGAIIKGVTGQIVIGDLAFQAELRSLEQHFSQWVGALSQPKCRSDLGDTGSGLEGGCRFTMPAPVLATVTSVTNRTTFIVSASGSFPAGTRGSLGGGFFAEGTCTFVTGPNHDIAKEILDSTELSTSPESLQIITKAPFGLDISVGETANLQIGCDKTLEVCRRNYNNVANFRGEPYVPGTDSVFRIVST